MSEMTHEERAALRATLASATPGPWKPVPREANDSVEVWSERGKPVVATDCPESCANSNLLDADDAEAIVAAVNAVPALLDEIEWWVSECGERDAYRPSDERLLTDPIAAALHAAGKTAQEAADFYAQQLDQYDRAWRGLVAALIDSPDDVVSMVRNIVRIGGSPKPEAVAKALLTCTAWGHKRGAVETKDAT